MELVFFASTFSHKIRLCCGSDLLVFAIDQCMFLHCASVCVLRSRIHIKGFLGDHRGGGV